MVQTLGALQTLAESLTLIYAPAFAARTLLVTWRTCLAARASLSDAIVKEAVALSRMWWRYAQTAHWISLFSTSLNDTMASGLEMVRPLIVSILFSRFSKQDFKYNITNEIEIFNVFEIGHSRVAPCL